MPNFPAMKEAETLSAIASAKTASYPQLGGSQFRHRGRKEFKHFNKQIRTNYDKQKTKKQKGQNKVKKLNTIVKQQYRADKQDVRLTLQSKQV